MGTRQLLKVRRFLNIAIYTLYSVQSFSLFSVSPLSFLLFLSFSSSSFYSLYFDKAPVRYSAIRVPLSHHAGTRIMHKIVEIAILRDLKMR